MQDKIVMFRSITQDTTLSENEVIKFINWGKGDIQQALNYYFKNLEKGKIKKNSQPQQNTRVTRSSVLEKGEANKVMKEKQNKIQFQKQDEQEQRMSEILQNSQDDSFGNSKDAFQVLKKGSQQHKKTHDFIKRVRQIYKLPIRGKPQKQLVKSSKSCLPQNEGQIPDQFLMVDCLTQAFNSDYIKQLSDKKAKQKQNQINEHQIELKNDKPERQSQNLNNKKETLFPKIEKKQQFVQISISQSQNQKISEEDSFKDIEEYEYKHVYSKSQALKPSKSQYQAIKQASAEKQHQKEEKEPNKRGRKKESKNIPKPKAQQKPAKPSQIQPTLPILRSKTSDQHLAETSSRHPASVSQSHSQTSSQIEQKQLFVGDYFLKGFCTEKGMYERDCIGAKVQILSFIQELKTKKRKFGKNSERTMNMRVNFRGRTVGRINDDEVRVIMPLIDLELIRMEFYLHDIPILADLYKPLTLRGKVYIQKPLITEPVVQNFEPHENDKDRVHQLSALLQKLSLPIETEPLIKTKSKYIKSTKPPKKKYESIDIMQYNAEKSEQKKKQEKSTSKNDFEEELKRREEQQERNKNQAIRIRNDPYFKQRQQSLMEMVSKNKDNFKTKLGERQNAQQDDNHVKKKVIQIDTQAEKDKLSELIELHEDNCEPYYPQRNFNSQLYPYQALALAWMLKRQGFLTNIEDKEQLHPLWTEYKLTNSLKYEHLYFNQLTGQLCIKRPTAVIKCKGGILADEMGLGKTVMMTALISTNPPPPQSLGPQSGGTLVILPLTLLSQWQSQISKHTRNQKSIIYYSSERKKIANSLHKYDIVLSTYGTISHQFAQGYHNKKNGIYRYKWHRVILDEAHYIKGRVIQTSKAVYQIVGNYRWCLTGTPIQNSATDVFSLLHFIKYTPWSEFACWNRFIVKPLEEQEQSIYNILRTILKQVFLRRTKNSKQQNGKPIIELPPRISKVQVLTLSQKERQFYDSIYMASRSDFDALIDKGILEAKYMQVLEMLMRLRQICCHPILFKSLTKFSKTTEQFQKQLRKLLQRSTKKHQMTESQSQDSYFEPIIDADNEEQQIKTSTNEVNEQFLKQVLQKIANNNLDSCMICLEQPQEPVINCCLHIFCKPCNIRQIEEKGFCGFCRRSLAKDDFIHLPRENRLNIKKEEGKQSIFLSTKMIALNQHLNALKHDDKVVIFSQFLGMLDLLEDEIQKNGFSYVRMEGSNTHKQRTKIVKSFQQDPKVKIFLVSLKTAGVGLNLVAANKVFLMDPWWNPAVEQQAIQRVHRIGQKREVQIVRFIIDKTIQTRMLELNTEKKALSQNILNINADKDGVTTKQKIQKLKYLMENY